MMAELQQASFRGIKFLWQGTLTTEEGRRLQPFEFPDSDARVIQDRGYKQPTYRVQAVVSGNTYADYAAKVDQFREALNTAGAGKLIHPTRGEKNVRAGVYTLDEGLETHKVAVFTVEFIEERRERAFSTLKPTPYLVRQLSNSASTAVASNLQTKYPLPPSKGSPYSQVYNTISEIGKTLTFLNSYISLGGFDLFLRQYRETVSSKVNNAELLAHDTDELFTAIDDNNDDLTKLKALYLGMMGFTSLPLTTNPVFTRRNEQLKVDLIEVHVQTFAWCRYAATLAEFQYLTLQELLADRAVLLAKYNELTANVLLAQQVAELGKVVDTTLLILDDVQQTLYQEIEYALPSTQSLNALVYSTYGNLNELNALELINYQPPLNGCFVEGSYVYYA